MKTKKAPGVNRWKLLSGFFANRLLVLAAFCTLGAAVAHSQEQISLTITGLPPGSQTVLGNITSYSFGVSNVARSPGGGGASKATSQPLKFTRTLDKSSPIIFNACATGKVFTKAVLNVKNADSSVIQLVFKNAVFTQVTVLGASGVGDQVSPAPTETVTLSYSGVTFTYTPPFDTGAAAVSTDTDTDD